jgi:hypothetical protein
MAASAGQVDLVQIILNNHKVKPEVISQTLLESQQADVQRALIHALLEAGSAGVENALMAAARTGQAELVRQVLAKANPKQEALTKALEATPARQLETQKLLLNAVLEAGGEAVDTALLNAAPREAVP